MLQSDATVVPPAQAADIADVPPPFFLVFLVLFFVCF